MATERQPTSAAERAAKSAGRAAGYCWSEHPREPLHCTRPPNHSGAHKHFYARVEWQ